VVLSLDDIILLRNKWSGELLINTMLKAKLIERGIPELGTIVTAMAFKQLGCSLFNLKAQLQKCSNTSSLFSKKKTQEYRE
jgi:hypothetical protein